MTAYSTVTELPGSGATSEQLAMLATRYQLAATLSAEKDVLEVACGPGVGLGYLARRAHQVVGGDRDGQILQVAQTHYRRRIPLMQLDACALPVSDQSFDVVILFEALYYLARPEAFVREARRVLRPQGAIVISTVNKDCRGFNASPLSRRYFAASELRALLESEDFAVEVLGGFPNQARTLRQRVLAQARQVAVTLHLVPPTMKGKQLVKRLVYGRLTPIPAELGNGATVMSALVPLAAGAPVSAFKVLYAVGRRGDGPAPW